MLTEAVRVQCGVAPNSEALIVGRAVAGLGCAGIFSGALIILSLSVPVRNRPIYTGLVGGMFGRRPLQSPSSWRPLTVSQASPVLPAR